jgi:hypothetical protein
MINVLHNVYQQEQEEKILSQPNSTSTSIQPQHELGVT